MRKSVFEECEYPIGYNALRKHISISDKYDMDTYLCTISINNFGPIFRVRPIGSTSSYTEGRTPSEAWKEINDKFKQLGYEEVDGLEMFGLNEPVVMNLIKERNHDAYKKDMEVMK